MREFVALRTKTISYLIDDDNSDKNPKGTTKWVIKRILKFNGYKNYLFKNQIILKLQERFKSEAHNVYTEEINKIPLSSNDDNRLQTTDRITTYTYEYKHWESMQNKMIDFDDYTNENKTKHNSNWPYISDPPYRIVIIGGSGSGKTNALLNLINNQPDIDKIYLYAKDPYEAKYQFLINKRESTGLKHFNDPKAFIEYSNDMHDVYKNINDYNPDKENKILIVFDDMIADIINNKKLNLVVTELFIKGRKLNISLVLITQPYFKVSKDVRLDSAHFFIMKFPIKQNLDKLH